jgi:hypothetical protein
VQHTRGARFGQFVPREPFSFIVGRFADISGRVFSLVWDV